MLAFRKPKTAGIVLLLIISGCFFIAAQAHEIKGRVVSIADGDTLTVLDNSNEQHKVRLNGIDAPELGQSFGQKSKRNLSDLVTGKPVTVEWTKTDRYGRIVATVTTGQVDVNLAQLKAGMAWYFRQYERDVPVEKRRSYEEAEAAARAAKIGLWAEASPQPPWDYRHPQSQSNDANVRQNGSKIVGNKNSGIFHAPNCPDYNKVSERNRIYFSNENEAVKAGFRKARNCP